jgi:HEAT repeat protein
MLADPDRVVRLATLQRMQRETIPVRLGPLGRWLEVEYHSDRVAVILASLHEQPAAEVRPHVEAVVCDRRHSPANRLAALDLFIQGLDEDKSAPLLTLAQVLEDGPILAQALRRIGEYPHLAAVPLLRNKLKSPEAAVRAAAIEAMGELRVEEGRDLVFPLLQDQDAHVRRAAAGAAGKLEARRAIESLLKLTSDSDLSVRHASLVLLR